MAPGTAVEDLAVRYRSIRPLKGRFIKTRGVVAIRPDGVGTQTPRFSFTPSLELVPGALSQARERLRLRRFRKFHGRKSRRAEQRVQQRAVLRAQTRHFFFEQPDIARPESLFKLFKHM